MTRFHVHQSDVHCVRSCPPAQPVPELPTPLSSPADCFIGHEWVFCSRFNQVSPHPPFSRVRPASRHYDYTRHGSVTTTKTPDGFHVRPVAPAPPGRRPGDRRRRALPALCGPNPGAGPGPTARPRARPARRRRRRPVRLSRLLRECPPRPVPGARRREPVAPARRGDREQGAIPARVPPGRPPRPPRHPPPPPPPHRPHHRPRVRPDGVGRPR